MAHHVNKKAAKGHNANRPKKSRPSDIFRTPPSYPALPDIPWMTEVSSLSGSSQTVSVEVTPEDTPDTLKSKLSAAGAASPETFVFSGQPLTGKLADAGLTAATTIDARVVSR